MGHEKVGIFRASAKDGGTGSGSRKPRDLHILEQVVFKGAPPPDIDAVNLALDNELDALLGGVGVPRVDRDRIIADLRGQIDGGNRREQTEAAERILELKNNLTGAVDRLSELRMIGKIFPPADDLPPPIL